MDINNLTIKKAHDLLSKREISVSDLAKKYLNTIREKDGEVHAYLEVYDDVLKQCEKVQRVIDEGKGNLLTGIPIVLKDNILVKGKKASAGSKILEGFVSPYDSTVVEKLKGKGTVFMGRANMDEFAMGSSTENSAFGVTRNPYDIERVAGGSSGGSTAAVAADETLVALGSDTGGSVRQPASFCGVVGLKPTYGAVSRHGLIALASSLDVIGPIARSVEDVEIIFEAIKGKDKMDSTSFYPEQPPEVSKNIRIGVPRDLVEVDGLHLDVKKNFEEALERLRELGFNIVDVNLPRAKLALAVYYILVPAEASSNLARFDGVKYGMKKEGKDLLEDYLLTRKEGFGKEVRRRILLGTYVLSAGYYDSYYGKANLAREEIKKDFTKVFESVDVIMTPTTPTPAFKIGEKVSDPLEMYLADIFTVSANITNLPAISLPSGFSMDGDKRLPLGVQFIGRSYEENTLFSIGKLFLGENDLSR